MLINTQQHTNKRGSASWCGVGANIHLKKNKRKVLHVDVIREMFGFRLRLLPEIFFFSS